MHGENRSQSDNGRDDHTSARVSTATMTFGIVERVLMPTPCPVIVDAPYPSSGFYQSKGCGAGCFVVIHLEEPVIGKDCARSQDKDFCRCVYLQEKLKLRKSMQQWLKEATYLH